MNKILVIANLYPSKDDPTFGTFVKNFVDEISVFMPDAVVEKSVIYGRTSSRIKKVWKYVRFYVQTFFKILVGNYDLVYVHYISHSIPPVWLASKFRHLHIAFNIHGDDLLVKSRLGEVFLEMAKPLMCMSKLIVVPSSFFAEVLAEKIPAIQKDVIFVSPSGGIKKSFFHKPKDTGNSVPKLGYVSRVDKGKGWDVFLNALFILKQKGVDVKANIIGTGEQVEEMRTRIKKLDIEDIVEYIGPVAHDNLPDYYKGFDLFVFPTLLPESLGLVGIEAMASGVPVVGSRIGGLMTFIVDGKNGFMFEVGDSSDLCRKIVNYILLTDNEKTVIREDAYQTALEYESSLVSTKLFNTLKKVYNI